MRGQHGVGGHRQAALNHLRHRFKAGLTQHPKPRTRGVGSDVNQRHQTRQHEQGGGRTDVEPVFGAGEGGQQNEGDGCEYLPAIGAPNGRADHARGFRPVPGDEGRQTEVNDQEQRGVEVDGEHHPPVLLFQESMGQENLADEGQSDRQQVGADQPRSVPPAGGGAVGVLAHGTWQLFGLSSTSAHLR